MVPKWFKQRNYKHFDVQVSPAFIKNLESDSFVVQHSWSPLIHYKKHIKRYDPKKKKTPRKPRDIMYASHRDSCILSKYSCRLTSELDELYAKEGLSNCVIGYRKLGKANYNFSADAQKFARENAPCIVVCFDISGFFDNLDHPILKSRLKSLLGVSELTPAWHKVFRHVTKYHKVELEELKANIKFGPRFKSQAHRFICSIEELKNEGIKIQPNKGTFGIPQGTPISAAFANLYLLDLDRVMFALCSKLGAMYQRYSDDIIFYLQPQRRDFDNG